MAWAPDYCTTGELKAFVRIGDNADDTQIALAIAAASRSIDRTTARQFGVVDAAQDRYYTACWDRRRCRWVVEIDDVMTTTGLTVAVDLADDQTYTSTIPTTGYRLLPLNAAAAGRPWTKLVVHPDAAVQPTAREGAVEVHALFGWTTVPDAIKQACLLQASRLLARRDSPFGVAGSPDAGSEVRLLARLDPDVKVAVGPYRRWWGAVA